MASIIQHGSGWRALVKVGALRDTRVCRTKREAQAWAVDRERELRKGPSANAEKPFRDALQKYSAEVSQAKKGKRWEELRLKLIGRGPIADRPLGSITQADIAGWRDARLREVSPGTVKREMNLINHVFAMAVREWKWISESPCVGVRKPSDPPARDRRISTDELTALMVSTGYIPDIPPAQTTSRVGAAILFAIETGVRAGELCAIEAARIKPRFVHIPHTKNGYARDVPLSAEARRILDQVLALKLKPVFGLTPERLDALFRKARNKAGIDGLHFHDTRHEAVSRLSRKLDVLALARMIGHRDIRQLQVYYSESPDAIADRL